MNSTEPESATPDPSSGGSDEVILSMPLDMHLHFRDGAMMDLVAPLSGNHFAGGVIMPNLVPPVDRLDLLQGYAERIRSTLVRHGQTFEPFMTLFFRSYTEAELTAARDSMLGIKLYPASATTNSEAGVRDIRRAEGTLKLMEELGIPLLVHGETHGFVMDRETEFMAVYRYLSEDFPGLRITMEHITTADAVRLLDEYENLHATVTLQHLLITLDDLAGGLLRPHLFCKPIAKTPGDREALLEAALQGHPKLMFGSDSAPHPRHAKEAAGCAAGVFTAPIALPKLAELFAAHGKLANLQTFVSDNARRIYGVTPPEKRVVLTREPSEIPSSYSNDEFEVIPFEAGQKMEWSVSRVDD